jgi:hypothetical protein
LGAGDGDVMPALAESLTLVLLVGSLVGVQVVKQIVAREYDSWAPALARALVRVAGWVHPPRAREWRADMIYVQSAERETGLWEAFCHLVAAPKLSSLVAARCVARGVRRAVSDRDSLSAGVASGGLEPFRPWLAAWITERTDNAGNPYDLADTVYELAQNLAYDPQVVSFVVEPDSSLRGLAVCGAAEDAALVSRDFYDLHPGRFSQSTDVVEIADANLLDALRNLAVTTANFFCDDLADDEYFFTIVFCGGSPASRLGSAGGESWNISRSRRNHVAEKRLSVGRLDDLEAESERSVDDPRVGRSLET